MKKALLLAAAMGVAAPVWAEWSPFSIAPDSSEIFVDHATIRSNGQMRRVWMMANLAKPDKDGDRSFTSLMEVNCGDEQYRQLQYTYYKGPKGSGDLSVNSKSGDWAYVTPGTFGAQLMKFLCSK